MVGLPASSARTSSWAATTVAGWAETPAQNWAARLAMALGVVTRLPPGVRKPETSLAARRGWRRWVIRGWAAPEATSAAGCRGAQPWRQRKLGCMPVGNPICRPALPSNI